MIRLITPLSYPRRPDTKIPTTTVEIKYGKKLKDCVIFFRYLFWISLNASDKASANIVPTEINSRFNRTVFRIA